MSAGAPAKYLFQRS